MISVTEGAWDITGVLGVLFSFALLFPNRAFLTVCKSTMETQKLHLI